jgi:hypothetical protein
MQILHSCLSIFSVENSRFNAECGRWNEMLPKQAKDIDMRIVETTALGLVALGAQMLLFATILM